MGEKSSSFSLLISFFYTSNALYYKYNFEYEYVILSCADANIVQYSMMYIQEKNTLRLYSM